MKLLVFAIITKISSLLFLSVFWYKLDVWDSIGKLWNAIFVEDMHENRLYDSLGKQKIIFSIPFSLEKKQMIMKNKQCECRLVLYCVDILWYTQTQVTKLLCVRFPSLVWKVQAQNVGTKIASSACIHDICYGCYYHLISGLAVDWKLNALYYTFQPNSTSAATPKV